MSVGFADDEEDRDDPLAGFDSGEAAEAVGRAGQLPVDAVSGGAAPEPNMADVPLTADPEVPQQGAMAADGPHTPVAAGSTPAPATEYPPIPQFPELGAPPPPPAFTGDPQKDVALNAQWQRDLTAHHGELTKRQTALAEHAAAVGQLRGKKEAEAAAVDADRRKAEVARAAAERQERQRTIAAAVAERAQAAKDLEGFKWDRPHTGREIFQIIGGAIAAGLQNAAAAQLGQVGNAQNEGLKAIRTRMEKDYAAKKLRLQGAGDALLMARYGAKDAVEAHRAAMNDLDAEFAAKNRTIATEAEEQLRRAGVPAAQIKGNVIVAEALKKAAEHEGDIHNREEGHRDQRQQAAATLALARANLGERRAAREDALADKKEAREIKHAEAEEARILRDPETGNPLGVAPTAKTVEKLGDNLSKLDAYENAVEQLAAHIEKHGRILNPFSAEYKQRESLSGDVQALGRGVKGIQATDSGQKLEHMIVGGKGVGLERAADPGVLRHLASQARRQTEQRLRSTLKPLAGESQSRAPSGGGHDDGAPRVSLPAQEPAARELSQAQAATLIDHLRKNPNDPRAEKIRQRLTDAGYKVPNARRRR